MKLKRFERVLISVIIFFHVFLCVAMEYANSTDIYTEKGHHFETVTSFMAVSQKVDELLAANVDPDTVYVLADWDDTIIGADTVAMGAWSPLHPDKSKVRTEEDVDHRLRDPNTLGVIQELKAKSINIIVTTARPPIRDLDAINTVQERHGYSLFDIRFSPDHPELPNAVNLNKISEIITALVNDHEEPDLIIKTREKIQIMQERSGIILTGQPGLSRSPQKQIIFKLENQSIVYDDGFAFVGHKKGPAVFRLLRELNINNSHIIVIDDSKNAITTYTNLLSDFTKENIKLFFLHYPVK
jgi:hypothetical protein